MFKYFYQAHDEIRKIDIYVYAYSEKEAMEKAKEAVKLPLWRLMMVIEVFEDREYH